jgi:2'-5' RNA ligase
VQGQLRGERLDVRVSWTRPANLHLSLQFIGLVGEEMIEPIGAALAGVAAGRAGFEVPVVGVGAFPHVRKARVLWAGCDDAGQRAGDLARAIRAALEPLGFPPERRRYTAHITLARIRRPRPDAALTAALDCLTNKGFGTLRVDAIHLFQSQLHPEGSIYTKLSSHDLTGADVSV